MVKDFFVRLKNSERIDQFLILLSFLITFGSIRTVTNLQKLNLLPNQTNSVLHIHHLVPGIILIIVSGYIGLSFWSFQKLRILMSVIFGIGSALTIDEFALWLYLRDVYWEKQGRNSIDAVIITIILLTLAFVISEIYDHRHIKRLLRRSSW